MLNADLRQLAHDHPDYVRHAGTYQTRNFLLLVLDSAFFSFALGMLSQDTILPYFVAQLSSSHVAVGMIPALYYAGLFLPQVGGAYLAHGAVSRKWLIFWIALSERIGMLIIALAASLVGYLGDPATLLLVLLGYALFAGTNGLIGPAYSDFISRAIFRRRGLFYGVKFGIGSLAGFSAGLLATHLLERYTFPTSLQWLFWGGTVVSFVSPLFLALLREVPFPIKHQRTSFGEFVRELPGQLARVPALRRYLWLRMVLGLGIIGNSFYTLYALEQHAVGDGYVGRFALVILLSQSLLGLLWGWWGDRHGYRAIYVLNGLMFVLSGLIALLAQGGSAMYVIAVGLGGYYALTRTVDPNMVMELAPVGEVGRYTGIINTLLAPSLILAALGGGLVVEYWGYRTLFILVLVIGVVSMFGLMRYLPDPRQPN